MKLTPGFPTVNRRQFLAWGGIGVLGLLFHPFPLRIPLALDTRRAADRATHWAPKMLDLVQWRYIAGRISEGGNDYGFIVSISDLLGTKQMLVQRKDFTGNSAFVEKTYTGSQNYDISTRTYTFKDTSDKTLLTWQWSEGDSAYNLTVTTNELTLNNNVTLKPQGDLIAEGGDGEIQVGRLQGYLIDSDYHADWVKIEMGGQEKGHARVDMQGLRLSTQPTSVESEYSHHWFAIAATLNDDSQVWISVWRIEALEGPYWTVTIAQGSGATWSIVRSLTEGNSTNPVTVTVLEWQPVPKIASEAPQETGSKWLIQAPDGSLQVEVTVPPGQFITSSPLSGLGGPTQMQEATGTEMTGTVLGQNVKTVHLAVAESTAEFYRSFLPIIIK